MQLQQFAHWNLLQIKTKFKASRIILWTGNFFPSLDDLFLPLLLSWFQDGLLNKFVEWSETSKEPLRSYATGLLAAAMEVQDIADTQREANVRLVSY